LFATLGTLFTQGQTVKWERLYQQPETVISLPTYPFQKERYWFDQIPGKGVGFNSLTGQPFDLNSRTNPLKVKGAHPLLDEHHPLSFMANGHIWTVQLNVYNPAYLEDHKFQGMVLLPGAAFVEMGLAALKQALGEGNYILKEIEFKESLILPQKEQNSGFQALQIALTPDGENIYRLQISSQLANANWKLHAVGKVELNDEAHISLETAPSTFADIQNRCAEQISGEEHYQIMLGRGLQYGANFQAISQIWRRDGESLSQISLPFALLAELNTYNLHPVLLDAAFQTVAMAFPDLKDENGVDEKFLPVGLGSIKLLEPAEPRLWCHAVIAPDTDFSAETICANLFIHNEQGREIAQVSDLQLKRIKTGAMNQETVKDWLYELQWQSTPRPPTILTEENPYPEKAGSWLIFSDKNNVGEKIRRLLEAIGETCWMVSPAEVYQISEQTKRCWLNPAKPEDFGQFLSDSLKSGLPPYRGIIHLWGLDNVLPVDTGVVDLERANLLGSIATLHIIQAVNKLGWSKLPRLWLVTRGSQIVQNELTTNSIAQFPLWGFGGTVTNELPELGCVRVDLSRVSSEDEVQALFQELWVKEYGDQIALRGNSRFVQRIVRYQSKPQPETETLPEIVYPEATYLITGGLGGLGLAVTRWMVQKGARHLVLMSRRTPSAEIEAQLNDIRALGVEIVVAQADVSNEDEVSRVICQIEETMPELRGIIHSALVLNDALIPDLTAEKFEPVMKPKLAGAWHLHNLTLHLPLDFFVMFSSVASLVGSAGQGNYVAGSAFLDGLAHYRKSQGLPALCINWGPWSEVGFAAKDDHMRKRMAARGVESLNPRQGLESLELLLVEKATQVGVIRANWNLLRLGNPLFRESTLLSNLITDSAIAQPRSIASLDRSSSRTKIMETTEDGRLGLVETYLCEIIAEVLGLVADKLDTQQSLYEMGFDSLVAVEIKNRIETDLLVVIPVSQLMQGPSINQLASEVLELFMAVVATMPQLQPA
jgi:acyl transferase domain-containing protein/acyl carrier protein